LVPGEEVRFMFDGNDLTQLFHIELEKQPDFKQVRILLRP
jgi:hypothetical protein